MNFFAVLEKVSLDKIGGISTIKTKVFGVLFCIVFDLDKNLKLRKENFFSFPSLNRFFALSLDKIGGISTIKTKVFGLLFCIVFVLHYLCMKKLLVCKKTNLLIQETTQRIAL